MGSDERDRRFDKALSRHLRASHGAAEAALQRGSCPDAETLAAYHERSLLPEELNSWKEHIVGCAHCQMILAQLESTDQIPLEAADKEEAHAMGESVTAVTAQNLETLPVMAAPGKSQAAPETRLRGKARPFRLSSGVLPPAPSDLPKSKPATDETASSNTRAESGAIRLRQKPDYQARSAPEKPFADTEKGLRKDAGRDSSEEMLRAGNQADLDAKAVAGPLQEKLELQEQGRAQPQGQAANVQSQNQNAYSSKVAGPAPLNQAQPAKKMKTAPPAPAAPEPPSAGVAGLTAATSMMEAVTVSNPRLISPPGSNAVWRAGRAGLIEFSSDNGASWSRQTSGVLVDLLAGSAPSDKVCWMVGRVGAVLLTTDGGAHWKSIAAPLSEDLGFVHALDAFHATIWNARNTKSFETRDGGLTWQRVAHP